ncbi:MAG: DUF6714 family protein [Pseudomonadota bacterium]
MVDTQTLITQILEAFAEVRFPGDDNLAINTYGDEAPALIAEFTGKDDWRSLDPKFLDQAPDGWANALCFFSAAARQFYLPAYLIADLREQLEEQDPAFILTTSLTPNADRERIARIWGGGTMGERARESFDFYSSAQAQVIVDYLFWKLEDRWYDAGIEHALEHYWLPRVLDSNMQ